MPIPFWQPQPAPPAALQGRPQPFPEANLLSRIVFNWITPFLKIGYSRPLQVDDLWALPKDFECAKTTDQLEMHFNNRLPPSRRLEKYQPESYITTKKSRGNKPVTAPRRPSQIHGNEELLAHSELQDAEVRAEVSEDLSLGTINSRSDRRGSEATVVSLPAETPEKQLVKRPLGESDPAIISKWGKEKGKKIAEDQYAVEAGILYDMSLERALFKTVKKPWWICFWLIFIDYALRLGTPLVSRQLIHQISLAHAWHAASAGALTTAGLERPRPLYHVVGLALAIPTMVLAGVNLYTHWTARANEQGVLLRSAAVDLISRKSMRLSGLARNTHTSGRLNTMVTHDSSFLELLVRATTALIVLLLSVIAGIGLLIWLLGYSALVGVGLLIVASPGVGKMFQTLCRYRQKQLKILDRRIRLMSEILNNMRAVKLYAYESHLGRKIAAIRQEETAVLREYGMMRATINSLFSFVPVIAIVLTFITYSSVGNDLTPATIFPALQLFDGVAQSLRVMPLMLTNLLDARLSLKRIKAMLVAEELESYLHIDSGMSSSIRVRGDFQYDSASAGVEEGAKDDKVKSKDKSSRGGLLARATALIQKKGKIEKDTDGLSVPSSEPEEATPFALRDINLTIAKGALVCIVGRVGAGKTALLMGMINEMRRLHGEVSFGGKVSFVPQHAWVQSGTVRNNITFSTDPELVDEHKIKDVIQSTGLQPDIDMWEDADLTLIGERGITLSGGQRQRICIARAAYDESEIVLLDDPLSAVDANVGHHLLHNCMLNGPFAHRTRVLVTHQLDVLPFADLVIVMDRDDNNEGRVVQQGTYEELRNQSGVFRTLMEDYGTKTEPQVKSQAHESLGMEASNESNTDDKEEKQKGGKLLIDEERAVGEIPWSTYHTYIKAIGAYWWTGFIFLSIVCVEGSRVTNSLFLGFWSQRKITGLGQGGYMGIYAGLAGAIAVATWICMYLMIVASYRASFTMFNDAWSRVMKSSTSWHDRTPTGRIIARMSKDVQVMDNRLPNSWNQYLLCIATAFGTFAVVVYSFPWLGFIFIPILGYLWLIATLYRKSSRETKRLESLQRSHMYSSLQEQLGGLPVIRAFGQQVRFEKHMQKSLDELNRAWLILNSLGAWLEVRLDTVSCGLIFGVSIFGALFRNDIDPAQFGVVLSFVLAAMGTMGQLVPLWVMCEQEMNSVERVQYYRELEVEANNHLPSDPKPNEVWPTVGALSFENVQLRYRPDLPLVLKGLTFDIRPGEKVGIIGRTGAGKSSIAQALFRTVEICDGKIQVDGRDLSRLGLEVVRSRLAVIPQDAFLFGGTVRENIDPTGVRTDAELNDAMSFIYRSSSSSAALREKFKLDGTVANDGSNFSAGERQLLSLMRALARKCKILLLDEATSSVDPETDALIQMVIQTEFSDVTLISIAHRLQTVAFYDRILVMDAGRIAEFDTPLNLFDRPNSIFRSLCQKKALGREDLVRIQTEAANAAIRSGHASPMPSAAPTMGL